VALLRNSRQGEVPGVLAAARVAIAAGANGITVHPRPDQRHVRPEDVRALAALVAEHAGIEFNVEGNPFAGPRPAAGRVGPYPGFTALFEQVRPHQATLVPDDDAQLTSDHGFDLAGDNAPLIDVIATLRATGARVSLFMDPDPAQIDRARQCGADRIELYTGPYAATFAQHGPDHAATLGSLAAYGAAAAHARSIGLGVNAGHDLDTANLGPFVALGGIDEVSIGHALIADALEVGLAQAVRSYLAALR
jgi:pyridoxine 5-phosphate synthase